MFFLTRAIIFSLVFSILPLSFSYAQENTGNDPKTKESIDEEKILSLDEAKELIFQSPTAKDALDGTVETDDEFEYYDIYSRKQAYRENTKLFTASIKQRQKDFEAPRKNAIQHHISTVKKVYKAESAEYNKELEENNEYDSEKILSEIDEKETTTTKEAKKEDHGKKLIEKSIPAKEGDKTKKKVIISDDSPNFDPANL